MSAQSPKAVPPLAVVLQILAMVVIALAATRVSALFLTDLKLQSATALAWFAVSLLTASLLVLLFVEMRDNAAFMFGAIALLTIFYGMSRLSHEYLTNLQPTTALKCFVAAAVMLLVSSLVSILISMFDRPPQADNSRAYR